MFAVKGGNPPVQTITPARGSTGEPATIREWALQISEATDRLVAAHGNLRLTEAKIDALGQRKSALSDRKSALAQHKSDLEARIAAFKPKTQDVKR